MTNFRAVAVSAQAQGTAEGYSECEAGYQLLEGEPAGTGCCVQHSVPEEHAAERE